MSFFKSSKVEGDQWYVPHLRPPYLSFFQTITGIRKEINLSMLMFVIKSLECSVSLRLFLHPLPFFTFKLPFNQTFVSKIFILLKRYPSLCLKQFSETEIQF